MIRTVLGLMLVIGVASGQTVDTILEKYIAAAGGSDALRKSTTRVMKGRLVTGDTEMAIDVIAKAPNKRVSIMHMPNAESFTVFDGHAGWMGSSKGPGRDMPAAESASAALDAEFALPLRLKEIYPGLRREAPEKIGDVECEVLSGAAPGWPDARFYFDRNSGLLVRMARFTATIDYADYRAAGGVKIPFRWTLSRPGGSFTIQITQVQADVPVDDAGFLKPR